MVQAGIIFTLLGAAADEVEEEEKKKKKLGSCFFFNKIIIGVYLIVWPMFNKYLWKKGL